MTSTRVALLLSLLIGLPDSAVAYTFGQQPLSDVRLVADYHINNCGGLTSDKLVAYMLTPTWWEVADATASFTPSPMALSRSPLDDGPTLSPPGQSQAGDPYRRAFWHPGIGAWQLDDSGDGISLAIEKFNIYASAWKVADGFCERYRSGDHSALNMFHPWSACASDGRFNTPDRDHCASTFDKLSNGQTFQEDPSTSSLGGSVMHTCGLLSQPVPFMCFYVQPTVPPAQGYTGSFIYSPYDGSANHSSPLAKPFYVYKQWPQPGDSNSYEWRYWMASVTGFGHDVAARRTYGIYSKTSLCWISDDPTLSSQSAQCNLYQSDIGLCDVSTSTGTCLGQFQSDGKTPIPVGGDTVENTVKFRGFVTDPLGRQIGLEIELHRLTENGGSFTGSPTQTSPLVDSGHLAEATANGLIGDNYHWRARTVNAAGERSSWSSYGNNSDSAADFTVGGSCHLLVDTGSGLVRVNCPPPPPGCYNLTLARNDSSGGGLPTASPAHSSGCGTGQYVASENIQVSAYPASSFGVGSWSGTGNDASTSTTNSLVMPGSSQTVTVNYVHLTQNSQPTLTTGVFDQVTATSANLHGWVNPNGLGTNVYFAYGTDVVHSPSYTGQQYIGLGTTTVPYSAVAANLACGTTYAYYAIGSNSAGTGNGQIQTFMTGSCPTSSAPTITSEWADGITQTSAALYALINPNGLQTTGNFQYGTNPASPTSTPPQPMGSATSSVELGWAINGLSCGTTYSFNAVASNSAGPSAGLWQTFRTLDCSTSRPSVANESVDGITQASATLHAIITPNGGNLAYAFFYYGLTSTYTNATPLQSVGTGSNGLAFTQSVSGLACGTLYHYQVTGQNSAGPTSGIDQTFRTVDCGGQPWGNGTVVVQATLDGAPWTGNVAYSVVGGFGYSYGSTVPASFPVSTVGIGIYGIQDIFGGPNAALVAVTPGFQRLADGATLTYTLQFSSGPSSQTGTIVVNATLDGGPWTGPLAYTVYGPHSFDGSGETTFPNLPAGAYGIVPNSGGPAGAAFAAVSPSGSDMTLLPGGTLTFTFAYETSPHMGILNTQATLDGSPWSGNITFQVSGPAGTFTHVFAPEIFVVPEGTYNVQYVSGGPPGTQFMGISPISQQIVSVSSQSTFSLDFASDASIPQVTTGAADGITQYSVNLHGNVNPNGSFTIASIEYGPDTNYNYIGGNDIAGQGTAPLEYTEAISEPLQCGTLYHYRATASNLWTTVHGTDMTFTTAPCDPTAGSFFHTVSPCRLLDTRTPGDPNGPAIVGGEIRKVQFIGLCGVRARTTAVAVNVTVVHPSADGFLTLAPTISSSPTSTINFRPGQVRANNQVVALNPDGTLSVLCGMNAAGSVDYIIDITGYFQQ